MTLKTTALGTAIALALTTGVVRADNHPATLERPARFQEYDYSPKTSFRVETAPSRVTELALERGEHIVGTAIGDSIQWTLGFQDGDLERIYIKPARPALNTNLIINTDRRRYVIELSSGQEPMTMVAWHYPQR